MATPTFLLILFAAPAAVDSAAVPVEPVYESESSCDMIYPFVIDTVRDPAIPIWDRWQFMRDGVPVSDSQVLRWAGDAERHRDLADEVAARGSWIYAGLGVGAAGTAISSVGWLLYGQDNVNQTVSLTMGIGGIVIGVVGFLFVADSIQRPVEPFLAPTPRHRLSRSEGQSLVYRLNRRFGLCRSPEIADE